jgi:hypothetical protein
MAVRPFRLGADRLLDLPSAYASNEQTRTRQTGEIILLRVSDGIRTHDIQDHNLAL